MATCKTSICSAEIDYSNYDTDKYQAAVEAGRTATAARLREAHKGELVGEIIGFPMADGQAQYMVKTEKPLVLIHLADFDAWDITASHMRGVRLADVRAMVARDRGMRELFSGRQKT